MVSKEVSDNFEDDSSQDLLATTVPAMTTSCAYQWQ